MMRSRMAAQMALSAMLMVGLAGGMASGQQAGTSAPRDGAGVAGSDAEFPSKAELLRRIALYEAAEQSAERTHPGIESMVKIYSNLAALYEDAGMYAKSEELMRREISLLRSGPQDELANAVGHMAIVHVAMGDLRQAEKDDLEGLKIRESVGDPLGVAFAWNDLADVYVKERQFKKALEYAQKAMAVLADNPKAEASDQIAARQALAYALCGLKECGQAIPLLKDALELEKSTYGADSLMVGSGNFLLGYTYWKDGKMEEAAELMAKGTARMKVDLGWGHVLYLNAMMEYAKFLRQSGQMEAAASAEREVKMANAVVDARTLSANGFVGVR